MTTPIKTRRQSRLQTIPERVATLREVAENDPLAAQDAAWAWFERLGKRTGKERETGADQLAELFACGQPSEGIDGRTDGMLVAPLIHPVVDPFLGSPL